MMWSLPLWAASGLAGVIFVARQWWTYSASAAAGQHPASDLATACWFVLTGVHAVHVAAGVGAIIWAARTKSPAARRERLHALTLYWLFLNVIWITSVALLWL
jgi:heme/copper-type cytochrome/quinol oxidase subunit 3